MKISPILILPTTLIFLLVWTWTDWQSKQIRRQDSFDKVQKCEQLADSLAKLRSQIDSTMSVAPADFDSSSSLSEVVRNLGVASSNSMQRGQVHLSLEDIGVNRMTTGERVIQSMTAEQVVRLIHGLHSLPNRIFGNSVRLDSLGPPKEGEFEKWKVTADWYYFQESK